MPTYGYECNECGIEYDDVKLIAERDNSECPECQSKDTRRLPAAPPFHLNGAGWTHKKKKAPKESLERQVENMAGRKPT